MLLGNLTKNNCFKALLVRIHYSVGKSQVYKSLSLAGGERLLIAAVLGDRGKIPNQDDGKDL